jgi:hypothetical protein
VRETYIITEGKTKGISEGNFISGVGRRPLCYKVPELAFLVLLIGNSVKMRTVEW